MLTFMFSLFSLHGLAQAITYSFDSKVIMADSLNMPESTIAKNIISILPELLERPGEYTLNDYQIKIEDMPVGEAVDAVLTQIRLCDIEKIEVSESPINTYQNNSKSGSINIFLRQRATESKPYWGSATLDVAAPLEIWPQLSFGYKKNKVTVRTMLFGDFYDATYDTDTRDYDARGNLQSQSTTSDRNKFWSNMQVMFLNYNPTEKDRLLMNVAYVHTNDKDEIKEIENHSATNAETNDKMRNLNVFMKYVHDFTPASNLECIAQYVHNTFRDDEKHPNDITGTDKKANEVFAQISGNFFLLPADSKYKSKLTIGAKGNLSFDDADASHEHNLSALTHSFCDEIRSKGFTPFVESENILGKFRLKLSANMPYYHYDFQRKGSERMEKDNTDLCAKIIAEWHFTQHHKARFIADRQSNHPDETIIYPYLVGDVTGTQYTMGNIELKNLNSHAYTLEYLFNNRWGSHALHMNLSGSYNHISNVIGSELKIADDNTPYTFYNNIGNNDLLIAQFMAMYSYKRISLTLTSDFYNNQINIDYGDDHYRYYNIVLMPTFTTKSNFMGSLRLKYCSPVDAAQFRRGGCSAVSMQLSKTWGNFNLHLYGNLALSGRTTDTLYYGNSGYTETIAYAYKNSIGLGLRYEF